MKQRIELGFKAMAMCRKHAGKERGVAGVIRCPACKGKLRYRVHASGVMMGKCDTKGCLAWVQQ